MEQQLIEAFEWAGFQIIRLERIKDPTDTKRRVWLYELEAKRKELHLIPAPLNPNWIDWDKKRIDGILNDTNASYLIGTYSTAQQLVKEF